MKIWFVSRVHQDILEAKWLVNDTEENVARFCRENDSVFIHYVYTAANPMTVQQVRADVERRRNMDTFGAGIDRWGANT